MRPVLDLNWQVDDKKALAIDRLPDLKETSLPLVRPMLAMAGLFICLACLNTLWLASLRLTNPISLPPLASNGAQSARQIADFEQTTEKNSSSFDLQSFFSRFDASFDDIPTLAQIEATPTANENSALEVERVAADDLDAELETSAVASELAFAGTDEFLRSRNLFELVAQVSPRLAVAADQKGIQTSGPPLSNPDSATARLFKRGKTSQPNLPMADRVELSKENRHSGSKAYSASRLSNEIASRPDQLRLSNQIVSQQSVAYVRRSISDTSDFNHTRSGLEMRNRQQAVATDRADSATTSKERTIAEDFRLGDTPIHVADHHQLAFSSSLTGTGNFVGSGTVRIDNLISPGNSPGIIHFGGNLNLGPQSSLLIEIAGTSPNDPVEFDQIFVVGNSQLNGTVTVDLLDGFVLGDGQTFKFLDVAGASTGMFSNLGEGELANSFVNNFSGSDLYISYFGGDGNDVIFYTTSNVPEPTSFVSFILAVGLIGIRRKRSVVVAA